MPIWNAHKEMLKLVADCAEVARAMPRGYAFLADQIKRASTSVPMLFSEGARRKTPKARLHYFDMSAGSARECSTIVDAGYVSNAIPGEARATIKERCDYICAMLYKFR